MKTVKHTFIEESDIRLVNDEVVTDTHTRTLYFSLPISALGLFEDEYGKPLIDMLLNGITDPNASKELDKIEFVRALACSMYIKNENGKISNNEATKEEFKNMEIYKSVASNVTLRLALTSCAISCIFDEKDSSSSGDSKPKK